MIRQKTISKRLGAREQLYEAIKQMIASGELKPGEHIQEVKLAEQLGFSRTPLREALHLLEAEEFLTRQPNGRLVVSPLSPEEAAAIFEMRKILEGLSAGLLVQRVTEEDIKELEKSTEMMLLAAERGIPTEVSKYGRQFHEKLHSICGSHILAKLLSLLEDHMSRYRSIGPSTNPNRRIAAAREHAAILKALKARDADAVRKLQEQHIENGSRVTIEILIKMLKQEDSLTE